MNRKELVESILKNKEFEGMSKRQADYFISSFMDIIKDSVRKGKEVTLVGFGTFKKVRRKARTGVNPSTGKKIKNADELNNILQ